MNEIRFLSRATGVVVAFLAVVLLGGVLAAAEPAHRAFAMREPGPGHRIEATLAALDLTSDQQTAIDRIFSERRESTMAVMQGTMKAEMALREQIESPTFDEQAIRQAAAAVGAMKADRAVAEATLMRDVRAVLTADQRAKLQELLSRPEGVHMEGMHMEGMPLEKMRSPE